MEQKKWWDNPTAAVGALMGEKAQARAEYQIAKKMQAEYEKGLQEGRKSAMVHGHWETNPNIKWMYRCSNCKEGDIAKSYINTKGQKYCPDCGARMDEVILNE